MEVCFSVFVDLLVCYGRKCTLSERERSERLAKRRKGGRTVCGCDWGWVVWVCKLVLWGVVSGRSSHGFASVARASGFYHIERSGSA